MVTPLYSVSNWHADVGSQVTRQSVTDPTLNQKGPNQLPNEPVQGCTRISWCPRGRNSSKRVSLQIKGDSEETSGIQNLLGTIIGEWVLITRFKQCKFCRSRDSSRSLPLLPKMIFPTAHQLTSKGTQGLDINFKCSDNPVRHSLRGSSSVVTPLYSVSNWDNIISRNSRRKHLNCEI